MRYKEKAKGKEESGAGVRYLVSAQSVLDTKGESLPERLIHIWKQPRPLRGETSQRVKLFHLTQSEDLQ